jgi:hypothetical protein
VVKEVVWCVDFQALPLLMHSVPLLNATLLLLLVLVLLTWQDVEKEVVEVEEEVKGGRGCDELSQWMLRRQHWPLQQRQ